MRAVPLLFLKSGGERRLRSDGGISKARRPQIRFDYLTAHDWIFRQAMPFVRAPQTYCAAHQSPKVQSGAREQHVLRRQRMWT